MTSSRRVKVLQRVRQAETEEKKQAMNERLEELQRLSAQDIKDIGKPYYALNDLNWNEYYRITTNADDAFEVKNKRALAAAEASEESARVAARQLAISNREKHI